MQEHLYNRPFPSLSHIPLNRIPRSRHKWRRSHLQQHIPHRRCLLELFCLRRPITTNITTKYKNKTHPLVQVEFKILKIKTEISQILLLKTDYSFLLNKLILKVNEIHKSAYTFYITSPHTPSLPPQKKLGRSHCFLVRFFAAVSCIFLPARRTQNQMVCANTTLIWWISKGRPGS